MNPDKLTRLEGVRAGLVGLLQAIAGAQARGTGTDDDDFWFVDYCCHNGHLAHDPCVGW